MQEKGSDFGNLQTDEVVKLLGSNLETGLLSVEVEKRLKQHGFNEVPEKKASSVITFAKKFWSLTAWMLEIIIVLSWFLQRYADLYIVTGLLVFNSVLGFVEEQKASGAVEALKEKLRVNARALRDGAWKVVPARELVPGDVVRIRSGDFVPADVKIVTGDLQVDQSALTGESFTVEKAQRRALRRVNREERRIKRCCYCDWSQDLLWKNSPAGSVS